MRSGMTGKDHRLGSELAGACNPAPASSDDSITTPVRHTGRRGGRWRWLTAIAIAAGLIVALGGAGYAFVLKSFPYQTPQDPPPGITLTPGVAADFVPYSSGLADVPVLTWRDVSYRPGLLVTKPGAFAMQLAVLRREGYQSISLSELEAVAAGRPVPLPGRPIVLTFDDGLSTDWTTVDPILRGYDFRGVVFINPANVASKSPSYFLTRGELPAMASSGRWDIGLALPGGWQSSREAGAAAARARNKLESDTGRQVTAFGWPALKLSTTLDKREPRATYAALREQFAAVFGRPVGGQASFVVNGSASAPLPRMNVTATDSLRSLSLRLRTGVQAPPPRDMLSLPWRPAGGQCTVTLRTLKVTGRRFALCTVLANGARWTDYGLRLTIAAAAGDTAIVELRDGRTGCLEIAIGKSELSVKQRTGRRWSLLQRVRVPPHAGADRTAAAPAAAGVSPTLIGADVLRVSIRLAGRTLWLQVRGMSIRQQVSPQVRNGVIALGLVAPGKRAVITFRQVTAIKNS
jgi:hypothetical protein